MLGIAAIVFARPLANFASRGALDMWRPYLRAWDGGEELRTMPRRFFESIETVGPLWARIGGVVWIILGLAGLWTVLRA